jgi:hypothetical protein
MSITFQIIPGASITTTHLSSAAALFSSAYGVWGPQAATHLGSWAKEGALSLHSHSIVNTNSAA